jgi:hypothetical protein
MCRDAGTNSITESGSNNGTQTRGMGSYGTNLSRDFPFKSSTTVNDIDTFVIITTSEYGFMITILLPTTVSCLSRVF